MTDFINHLLPAIEHFRLLSYWVVFLIAFAEALAFIGALVPGTTLIVMAGFLCAKGYFDFGDLLWFVTLGAILGDSTSFYLGKRGKSLFHRESKIFNLSRLEQAEAFFKKHGGKSILFGRFIGPVRSIIPFVAGMSRMDQRRFLLWNIASAIAWAVSHLLVGYFFGHAWRAIEIWSTRFGIVLILLAIFVGAAYWLKVILVKKGRQFFAFLSSIFASITIAIRQSPAVQHFASRYPATCAFLRARLRKDHFSGLPLSLLLLSFLDTLALFLGIVEDFLRSEPITAVDIHLANLVYAFRSPEIVQGFLWVTLLGKSIIVVSVACLTLALFWLYQRQMYMLPWCLTLAGSSIFVQLGKLVFHRPRPELSVYVETSFSFPSGHASISVACYGFIVYVLWKNLDNWTQKLNVVFGGIGVIFMIGISRIYLGVHYLSDVWAGYLLGALWLIIGVSLVEWQTAQSRSMAKGSNVHKVLSDTPSTRIHVIAGILFAAELLFYTLYALHYHPPLIARKFFDHPIKTEQVMQILTDRQFPKYTETPTGNQQEPLSFLILARNDDQLLAAFHTAGWSLGDPISLTSLINAAKADFSNAEDLTAPLVPYFWDAKVHDFGFQKPTPAETVRQRHHARFWKTDYRTEEGAFVYVGTASLDVGMKLITHKISPDIDAEREVLFTDLQHARMIERFRKEPFVEAAAGENFLGDHFFTDGMIYLIALK